MATLAEQIEKAEQAERDAAERLRDLKKRQRAHQRKMKAAAEKALGARVAAAAMGSEDDFLEVAEAIYAEHAEARAAAAGTAKRDMEAAQELVDVSPQEGSDSGYYG